LVFFFLKKKKRGHPPPQDHLEGFAPEVAWVTKSGDSELAEPIALRPTSETVMYPAFAKWVRSHRDLPLELNQWCNVVRWEFSHPTPFIRTREFLWQEGHCAYATSEEMSANVYESLEMYRRAYEEILAVPVIKGIKSDKEKFAGADFTTTVEAFIDVVGRGVQGATSHALGQNFADMFDIGYEDPNNKGQRLKVWQTSWGFTTRSIGVMTMVHGDDKGLVIPPRAAPIQAVIVPIYYAGKEALVDEPSKKLAAALEAAGVRGKFDDRDNYNPGWKYSDWELRGVPLRIEVGPRDAEAGQCVVVRRFDGRKETVALEAAAAYCRDALVEVQAAMLTAARESMMKLIAHVRDWSEVTPALQNRMRINAAWCRETECENEIKRRTKEEAVKYSEETEDERALSGAAKSLCIPLEPLRPLEEGEKCFQCGKPATCLGLFGRSY
jgi:prolyl-tRNA synthetase